ncbi:hypothetical protein CAUPRSCDRAFT_12956 [Caulochytrium protostelioides]|uniref:Uncharacterized protein n=1 Tax=Caulochytrium protostelioides TaxID=1555241 RepID=A0A4P9WQA6_9FUNG|nr:hypothetical protein CAUPRSCDRAFT_12956 [Caulochytrium protostelioides]
MTQVARPDERSVMTYVAQYFHAFAQQSKTGTAGRRVGALGQVLHQTWEMQNDYAERVAVLLAAVDAVQQQWRQHADFKGYAEAKQQLTDFESAYKTSTKRGWVAEKRALETLYSNIQTKLQTPPAGVGRPCRGRGRAQEAPDEHDPPDQGRSAGRICRRGERGPARHQRAVLTLSAARERDARPRRAARRRAGDAVGADGDRGAHRGPGRGG